MRKIKCMVVDDEPLALDLIEGYVRTTPFLDLVAKCSSAIEAMEVIKDQQIELIFLDIQMPGLSGVEFSRTLKQGPKVIFTTAFESYALEGYKVDALDYLLKPFNYEEFLKAANKAYEWYQLVDGARPLKEELSYIFIKSEYKLIKINLNEILFIEGSKDYLKVHLEGRPFPILTLMSLKAMEELLPESQFMRIHRSFIINLSKIESVERGQIIINKVRIAIADQYKDKFQHYISTKSTSL